MAAVLECKDPHRLSSFGTSLFFIVTTAILYCLRVWPKKGDDSSDKSLFYPPVGEVADLYLVNPGEQQQHSVYNTTMVFIHIVDISA